MLRSQPALQSFAANAKSRACQTHRSRTELAFEPCTNCSRSGPLIKGPHRVRYTSTPHVSGKTARIGELDYRSPRWIRGRRARRCSKRLPVQRQGGAQRCRPWCDRAAVALRGGCRSCDVFPRPLSGEANLCHIHWALTLLLLPSRGRADRTGVSRCAADRGNGLGTRTCTQP